MKLDVHDSSSTVHCRDQTPQSCMSHANLSFDRLTLNTSLPSTLLGTKSLRDIECFDLIKPTGGLNRSFFIKFS